MTLTNSGGATVQLSPCPTYTEHLSEPVWNGTRREDLTFRLDCGAGEIAPGRSLTFNLSMPVPATWPPGTAKYAWNLDVDGQPDAGGAITLE